MALRFRGVVLVVFVSALIGLAAAQQAKTGVLESNDLQKVVPTTFFFADQVAPVQMRNAVAVRAADGKIVAAALVDSSGYAADVAQKYQGFLITSKKITVEGKTLAPGQYGMGFTGEGKFHLMDAGANDVLLVAFHQDAALQHAVPLKMIASGSDFRLYAGKKYVTLNVQ
jgi:hypothetical protein